MALETTQTHIALHLGANCNIYVLCCGKYEVELSCIDVCPIGVEMYFVTVVRMLTELGREVSLIYIRFTYEGLSFYVGYSGLCS